MTVQMFGLKVQKCVDTPDIVRHLKSCSPFFALSWIVLRLGYYPTIVLHSITVEAPQLVQYFGAYHVFMILLSLLLVLNIQWSYFIMKVAYVALYTPKGLEDARSDSDSDGVEDEFQVNC